MALEIVVLVILQTVSAGVSLAYLRRHPLNAVFVCSLLLTGFYFLPAWAWVLGRHDVLAYSFGGPLAQAALAVEPNDGGVGLLAKASIIQLAFVVGGVVGLRAKAGPRGVRLSENREFPFLRPGTVFLAVAWGGLLAWRIQITGFDGLILPSETAVTISDYFFTLFLGIPLALLWIDAIRRPGFSRYKLLLVGLALFAALTGTQRRNVILVLLAFVGTMTLYRSDWTLVIPRLRWTHTAASLLAVLLVPTLWYVRAALAGAEKIGQSANRDFFQVLLGGQATGFPTLLLVNDVVDQGIQLFRTLFFIVLAPIPRSIFPAKPINSDLFIQESFGLPGNPSMFLIGDLYFLLGNFAIVGALLLGLILSRIYVKTAGSATPGRRLVALILFEQAPTLFKNGVSTFFTSVLTFVVVSCFVYFVLSGRLPLEKESLERGHIPAEVGRL